MVQAISEIFAGRSVLSTGLDEGLRTVGVNGIEWQTHNDYYVCAIWVVPRSSFVPYFWGERLFLCRNLGGK